MSITVMFCITPVLAVAVHPHYYNRMCEVYGWGNSGGKQAVGIIAAPECDLNNVCIYAWDACVCSNVVSGEI